MLLWLVNVSFVLATFGLLLAVDWVGLSPEASFILFVIASVVGITCYRAGVHFGYAVPSILLLSVLLLVQLIDLSPVQPATRAVRRITPGMSESAARSILREEFPPGGRFQPPGLERPLHEGWLRFALHPTDGRYDSAIVMIRFIDGRVVKAEFLPD
jgi:hypothetical protein